MMSFKLNQKINRGCSILFVMSILVLTACGGGSSDSSPSQTPAPLPTADELLPIEYICSNTITIKAAALTDAELIAACQLMSDEETLFHTLLETNNVPVSDDTNQQVRVVVFDSEAQYKAHGLRLFDINTDNGGVYIEGDGAFYAMECDPDWYGIGGSCEFGGNILNLGHEYVHYLDGRFDLLGGFCDQPGQSCSNLTQPYLVWWAEGLAEYVSKLNLNNNRDATTAALLKSYSLSELFNTSYNHDGDRVYTWGYMAVRFMIENHMDDVRTLLGYFRISDYAAYQTWVNNLGTGYDAEFNTWLDSLLPASDTLGNCDYLEPYGRTQNAASISVTNTTDTPINLYWVNTGTGQPLLGSPYGGGPLTASGTSNFSASNWVVGDRMVITNANDECLGVAVLTGTDNTYVVDASLFN